MIAYDVFVFYQPTLALATPQRFGPARSAGLKRGGVSRPTLATARNPSTRCAALGISQRRRFAAVACVGREPCASARVQGDLVALNTHFRRRARGHDAPSKPHKTPTDRDAVYLEQRPGGVPRFAGRGLRAPLMAGSAACSHHVNVRWGKCCCDDAALGSLNVSICDTRPGRSRGTRVGLGRSVSPSGARQASANARVRPGDSALRAVSVRLCDDIDFVERNV